MKLLTIPQEAYEDYRMDVIFDGYKWDPQFLDSNTIARHVIVLTEHEYQEIADLSGVLFNETVAAEQFINNHLDLTKKLNLSRKIRKDIRTMTNYNQDLHIRLMRFDFHPTLDNNWAISEVNSDVPGGFAESSLMPAIAMKHLPNGSYSFKSFGDTMMRAVQEKVALGSRIMMVHCTSYSDDRQVMQYLGDALKQLGYHIIYGAADHLHFNNHQAYSVLNNNEGAVDAIIRFTPLEWLIDIKPKNWAGYFTTTTTSCNHPIAEFAQSKCFPLIWDKLEEHGISLHTWRRLLPETCTVKDARGKDGFIFKPIWGRVGENISIKEACREQEYSKILKDVRKHPNRYIAQKMFMSKPLISENGQTFHVCLGSYVINGEHAGIYARMSDKPRIDSHAQDIPVLVERSTP